MDNDEPVQPPKSEPISPDWVHESIDEPETTGVDLPEDLVAQTDDLAPDIEGEQVEFEPVNLGEMPGEVSDNEMDLPGTHDTLIEEIIDLEQPAEGEVLEPVDEGIMAVEPVDQLPKEVAIELPDAGERPVVFEDHTDTVEVSEPVESESREDLMQAEEVVDEPTDRVKISPVIETEEKLAEDVKAGDLSWLRFDEQDSVDPEQPVQNKEQQSSPENHEKRFMGMTAVQRFFFFLFLLIVIVILGTLFLALAGKIALSFLRGLF